MQGFGCQIGDWLLQNGGGLLGADKSGWGGMNCNLKGTTNWNTKLARSLSVGVGERLIRAGLDCCPCLQRREGNRSGHRSR